MKGRCKDCLYSPSVIISKGPNNTWEARCMIDGFEHTIIQMPEDFVTGCHTYEKETTDENKQVCH